MKTLKKTLCLVLAVVMVVGVLILPAYAADNYDAAVTSLQNYGVLQGYPDGDLHTDASITRGQMAAIIYRIMTGDTESTDAQVADKFGSYADRYTDANVAPWAKGYIGFCTNAGVLKGYDTGAIQPNKLISGYEVMAMLLRALGYDHNNEYTGNNWQYNVLSDAAKTGINKKVTVDPAKATPRGAVAQYTYDAATQTDRVAPAVYPTVGYGSLGVPLMKEGTPADGEDDFGAPETTYTVTFTWPDKTVEGSKTVTDKPLAEYWTAVSQATVAKAAGLKKTTTMGYWLNGVEVSAGKEIDPSETSIKTDPAGAQGRYTAVYADRIVSKDVVIGVISKVEEELVVNGITVTDAAYEATVYYGTSTQAYNTAGITDVDNESLKKDDVFYSFCLADDSTAPDGVLDANDAVAELVGMTAITPTTVTVSAIITNDDDSATGFTAGSKDYMYNETFGYNTTGTNKYDRLADENLNDKWEVYLDGQGDVIGLAEVTDKYASGVGVGLNADAYKIKSGKYAAELVILNTKGGNDTIRFLNSSEPFSSETAAVEAAEEYIDNLIQYDYDKTAVANGYSGYYTILEAGNGSLTPSDKVDTGLTHTTTFEAGVADTLDNSTKQKLVNDDTVFFVAHYTFSRKVGGYVFDKYNVVTGFQNIKDLSYAENDEISGETITSLELQTINDANSTAWTKYALIKNATQWDENEKVDVPNHAFIVDSNKFVKAYDEYLEYSAIVNGKAGTALKFDFSADATITATGLYEYGDRDRNTSIWGEITASTNQLTGDSIYYKAGVIYNNETASSATDYQTVMKDVAVYVVNPETGTSTKLNNKLSDIIKAYGSEDMWYQTNEYGYINLIYVIGDKATGGAADSAVSTISQVTFGKIEDKGLISAATVTAETSDHVKAKTSLSWVRWDASSRTWKSVAADECFVTGGVYRVTITFTADSNYYMNLTPNSTTISTLTGDVSDGEQLCTSADSIRVEFTVD